jgi:hypothetical protein
MEHKLAHTAVSLALATISGAQAQSPAVGPVPATADNLVRGVDGLMSHTLSGVAAQLANAQACSPASVTLWRYSQASISVSMTLTPRGNLPQVGRHHP